MTLSKSLQKTKAIFTQHNADSFNAQLFENVIVLANTLGVSVRFYNANVRKQGGSYAPDTNIVSVNANDKLADKVSRHILHELIHSVTYRAIESKQQELLDSAQIQGIQELHDAYEKISHLKSAFQQEKNLAYYGAVNVHEMVAEVSNYEFRKVLKQHNVLDIVVCALHKIIDNYTNSYTAFYAPFAIKDDDIKALNKELRQYCKAWFLPSSVVKTQRDIEYLKLDLEHRAKNSTGTKQKNSLDLLDKVNKYLEKVSA
ncbi:hypothetical protein CQA49_07265 [Helicobacter sp. MIT 00-7814]|uniref:hypothetical protein n=1 Tax=unclassified Helicobacter TaxID=2593540 RepID=UPI000E1E543C|nr:MULTISPECIES: hypothetical protein [unclassified Helicobacter]RDU52709.1 hypothetical protein CQA37_08245 [Helicobacter sp. MIT 99-10781]RDU53143.1 hypothetical protein CQA49_07265 [Helicobacter sp. MIT 00-7814]